MLGQESHWESGMNSYYQQQTVDQPCNFSNSIYYGGQEVYSPTTRSNEYHVVIYTFLLFLFNSLRTILL